MAIRYFYLLFIIWLALVIHELGHTVLFILFDVPVENLAIGFGPSFSVLLQNPFLKKISFGLIPLGGFTMPSAGWELLSPWKLILIDFAGVAVNLSVPLVAAYFHKKRGKVFTRGDIFFFDINLCLFIVNIAPLPGFDGAHAYMNLLSIFGLTGWFEKLYSSLSVYVLYAWISGWFFIIFYFLGNILRHLKKIIKYDSTLTPR